MKIIYRTGDLLEAPEHIICHGCNAQGKMGAGIAVAIRKRYPKAFEDYRALYEAQGNRLELGQVVFAECPDGRVVIDAVTQEFYGRDPSIVYVSYDAIRTAIRRIDAWMAARKSAEVESVAFPKIGAGLANGDWDVIAQIIEDEARAFQPVVYTL
jgi:O-acetyl-ADP-ribose deacetylase (regulator of RNase III)